MFHRENKKPKDLKRAIGKLDKDDWNIKNIEDMIAGQCGGGSANNASAGGGNSANAIAVSSAVDGEKVPQEKVPKWSKAAFQVYFSCSEIPCKMTADAERTIWIHTKF